ARARRTQGQVPSSQLVGSRSCAPVRSQTPALAGTPRAEGTPPVRPALGCGRRGRNCSSRAGRGGHVVRGCRDKERAWEPERSGTGGLAAAGEINFSVIGRYVDYLVEEQGVKNVFVNGTTGEGLSLSISERCRVAEEWVTKGRNKLDQIVIHVGALSLKESQELAQHAAEIGADGIAVIAPFFLKPWNKDVLINFLKEVAAAAPALPFYYYHIPALTGVKIRAEELLDGIQDKIPSFQGLKFSDTDLLDFGQCVDQNRQRQFAFLFGVDEQLLSALVMGATGAVGSTYNYLGKKTKQMLEAFERKDFSSALNHQFCIQRFINFVVKLGFGVSQTKAIMTLVSGIPMGPPRLPLQKASREFTDNAEAKLKSLDFLSCTDLKDGNMEACS
uniref:N-acetylneuraminate lyase n=1 Tax=Bos indicus x Bos taurus TaxID=30522 RepID=A0A4W2C9N5_BOBOX